MYYRYGINQTNPIFFCLESAYDTDVGCGPLTGFSAYHPNSFAMSSDSNEIYQTSSSSGLFPNLFGSNAVESGNDQVHEELKRIQDLHKSTIEEIMKEHEKEIKELQEENVKLKNMVQEMKLQISEFQEKEGKQSQIRKHNSRMRKGPQPLNHPLEDEKANSDASSSDGE